MAANSKNREISKNNAQEQEADVLYQKLGNTWFAFSIVEDEVFMSPITEEEIVAIKGGQNDAPFNQAA